jgi:hypothetical protein
VGSYFENGSPSNYTIGGARLWFNESVDLTLTPPRRKGWRDLGNVVDHSFETAKEVLDHFSTKTGSKRKDRSVNRQITESLVVTLDEVSTLNMKNFFRGDAITTVAAGSGTGSVVDEVMQLNGTEFVFLLEYNPTAIVVKDITGVTTYVLTTDYIVETDAITGYKGIRRVSGGAITDGAYVRVNYTHDVRANKTFYPQTKALREGQALFFGVSDIGNEFMRSFNNVTLDPEGNFALSADDWSKFQLRVDILDDSDAVPTAPFGVFKHFGVGTNL